MEFTVKEGMSLRPGDRVEVYYNIQKGGFSIVSLQKPHYGKVIAYAANVLIENATFHLNLRKLEQIRAMHRKTVYATVKGTFIQASAADVQDHRQGYCNPYTTGRFIDWESKEQVTKASAVYFYDRFFSYKAV